MMFLYRVRNHVVEFFVRKKRITGQVVSSPIFIEAAMYDNGEAPLIKGWEWGEERLNYYGQFYVIEDCEGEVSRYYVGKWEGRKNWRGKKTGGKPRPVVSEKIEKAEFFLDYVAAEETMARIQSMSEERMRVVPVYLDYENTLPQQRFIVVIERADKSLWYMKDWDGETGKLTECKQSKGAMRGGFRQILGIIGELRAKERGRKFSMLHEIEDNVLAGELKRYLQENRQENRIALSIKL